MPLPWLRKPREASLLYSSFSSHTTFPWRGFALYAELDLWARAQGSGGSLCPTSTAHTLCDNTMAAEQGSCSPQPWTAGLTSEEGPGNGHTVLEVAFDQHTASTALCPTAELVVLCQPPQLHSHDTFTDTECAEQSSMVPSPSTNQSPHSNLFLLQFKVLWHFIWKIL